MAGCEFSFGVPPEVEAGVSGSSHWDLVRAAQPFRAKFDPDVARLTQELEHPFAARHGQGYQELKDKFAAEFEPVVGGLIEEAREYNSAVRQVAPGSPEHEAAQQGLDGLGLRVSLYRLSTRPYTTFYCSQFRFTLARMPFDQQFNLVSQNPVIIDLIRPDLSRVPIKTNLSRLAKQARVVYGVDPNNYIQINAADVADHLVLPAGIKGESSEEQLKRRKAEFFKAIAVLRESEKGSEQELVFAKLSRMLLDDIKEKQIKLETKRR